jgi:uncharacterized phage protein gp47/JayE
VTYGLSSAGFSPKPLSVSVTELQGLIQGAFGATVDLSPDSLWSDLIGVLADRESDLWQGMAGLYDAVFPDGATGITQDRLAALTGCIRQPATATVIPLTLTGTPGTVVAAGLRVSSPATGYAFATLAPYTIGGGGTVAGSATAVSPGAWIAPAGTVTRIDTPVGGLASVTNPTDPTTPGRDLETDAALRIRRESSLRALGGASDVAISAHLLEVPGVSEAFVYDNQTDTTDVSGVPPHAMEAVVLGGVDAAIAAVIQQTKPVGTATYGSTSVSVVGPGGTHAVKFSRPVILPIYVAVTATYQGTPPADLAAQIALLIANYGDSKYQVASPVIVSALDAQVFQRPEVVDVAVAVGLAPGPTSQATIRPTNRQLAQLDTSRIAVTLVAA